MQTILLVDNDLGFVFWLGHILDRAGYEALPAKSVPDALALLDELKASIDLLILNSSLPGAASFVGMLKSWQRHLRIIPLAGGEGGPPASLHGFDTAYEKPAELGDIAEIEWLGLVRRVLSRNAAVS